MKQLLTQVWVHLEGSVQVLSLFTDEILEGAAKRDRADYDGRVNDQVPVKARGVHFELKISAACNRFVC